MFTLTELPRTKRNRLPHLKRAGTPDSNMNTARDLNDKGEDEKTKTRVLFQSNEPLKIGVYGSCSDFVNFVGSLHKIFLGNGIPIKHSTFGYIKYIFERFY